MADLVAKGIILRKNLYSEHDIIFDVLTEQGTVLGFFARGARKIKSKFSGVLQLGLVVNINYTTGKNLNYPQEINVDHSLVFSFYNRSLKHMNFYTDILTVTRSIAKDFENELLFISVIEAFKEAEEPKNDLNKIYNKFLEEILNIIDVDTSLTCYFTGNTISEEKFYYIPETNRVISLDNKPKTIDVPEVTFDEIFHKTYLQRLVLEHIQSQLKFKF